MSYINLPNALLLAINDGCQRGPGRNDDGKKHRAGLPTGYLYEKESFEDVLKAYKSQVDYFLKWHVMVNNNAEYITRELLPLPVVSATMGGCMEKGMDVMHGGAKYNGSGIPGIGIGNIADSLFMIKHLCFGHQEVHNPSVLRCSYEQLEGAMRTYSSI